MLSGAQEAISALSSQGEFLSSPISSFPAYLPVLSSEDTGHHLQEGPGFISDRIEISGNRVPEPPGKQAPPTLQECPITNHPPLFSTKSSSFLCCCPYHTRWTETQASQYSMDSPSPMPSPQVHNPSPASEWLGKIPLCHPYFSTSSLPLSLQ